MAKVERKVTYSIDNQGYKVWNVCQTDTGRNAKTVRNLWLWSADGCVEVTVDYDRYQNDEHIESDESRICLTNDEAKKMRDWLLTEYPLSKQEHLMEGED